MCIILCEERMAQMHEALLQGGLEGRTSGKDTMMDVLDILPYLEELLDETFLKKLEEASNLHILILMGDLNCHNIF